MRIMFFVMALVATTPAHAQSSRTPQYERFKELPPKDARPIPHILYWSIARAGKTLTNADLTKANGITNNCLLLAMEQPATSVKTLAERNRAFNARVLSTQACTHHMIRRPANADLATRLDIRAMMLR